MVTSTACAPRPALLLSAGPERRVPQAASPVGIRPDYLKEPCRDRGADNRFLFSAAIECMSQELVVWSEFQPSRADVEARLTVR